MNAEERNFLGKETNESIRRREAEILENAARIWVELPANRSAAKIHSIYRDVLMQVGLLSRLTEEEILAIGEKVLREVA